MIGKYRIDLESFSVNFRKRQLALDGPMSKKIIRDENL